MEDLEELAARPVSLHRHTQTHPVLSPKQPPTAAFPMQLTVHRAARAARGWGGGVAAGRPRKGEMWVMLEDWALQVQGIASRPQSAVLRHVLEMCSEFRLHSVSLSAHTHTQWQPQRHLYQCKPIPKH